MVSDPRISSIILEALARRAKDLTMGMQSRVQRNPDVADYVAAFEDELKRYENTDTPADTPAQPRAKLLSNESPSLGVGLGQCTGGTAQSDSAEASRILDMIANIDGEVIVAVCGYRAYSMVSQMRDTHRSGRVLRVTGRQLFFLREIKDQLCEKGYL